MVSPPQGVPLDKEQINAAASADIKLPWRFDLDESTLARLKTEEGEAAGLPPSLGPLFPPPPPPPPSSPSQPSRS